MAKGLCGQCYMKQYDARRKKRKEPGEYSANYRQPPHKPKRNADCHPDLPHHAKGLCESCYHRQWTSTTPASCHPDKPVLALGLCTACYSRRAYERNPEQARRIARESGRKGRTLLRQEMLDAYGGRCACPNCPETDPAFLTLDHIGGGGKAHRQRVGSHTYRDLKRRDWPQEGYRLLCWNCNAMTRFGPCPHTLRNPKG